MAFYEEVHPATVEVGCGKSTIRGSGADGLEKLGVGQAGGGCLGVDQSVEETGLGGGESLGREKW